MLCVKEFITEENEAMDVQNTGLKASNQGVILTQAPLSRFTINAAHDCLKCKNCLYQ